MPLLDRAEKSLILAGQALDPNAPGGADLELAQRLLHDAALGATRVLAGGGDEVELEGDIARRATASEPSRGDVEALEAEARALVVRAVEKVRRPSRARRWLLRLGLTVLAVAPVLAVGAATPDWTRYRYKASSAHPGFSRAGALGAESRRANLLVHTEQQRRPWVEIDLGKERPVEGIVIQNRVDCCRQRGLPLVLERRDGDTWIKVAIRKTEFARWAPEFEPFVARTIRLRSPSRTILHFGEIQIR